MKIVSCLSLLACLALTPLALTATPLGTSFTYQGRLDNTFNANYPPGVVQMTFSLWTASINGQPIPRNDPPLPRSPRVVNSVFTVDDLDFGPIAFSGEERYLEIGINGVLQAPRTRVAPTPNAIYASTAGAISPAAQLSVASVTADNNLVAKQVVANSAAGDGIYGASSGGNGAAGVAGFNSNPNGFAGRFDGRVLVNGEQHFGAQARQMLNLWGTQYGIGVQSDTLYSRCDATANGGFIWYKGGVHHGGYSQAGMGGVELMHLVNDRLYVQGSVVVDQAGENSGSVYSKSLTFGISSGEGIASRRSGPGGGNQYGLDFYTGAANRMTILNNGNVGIGTINPVAKLAVNGVVSASSDTTEAFKVSGAAAGYELQDRVVTGAAGRWVMFARDGTMGFWNDGANRMTITSAGHLAVPVLTITGGADVAEPFKMSEKDLPKGAVVVIDEANPGHLRLSEFAYDTRVAGIISGANGVDPGIRLSQQGVMEGDQNVALSGRVYVQADTSNGPIKPGDLLTTSATPGHAMKVADHGKAQGAILGKAMTALAEGKGMVLVLVTLQ